MPVVFPASPDATRDAIDAYLVTGSAFGRSFADSGTFTAVEGERPAGKPLLCYPHVYVDVHNPDAEFNLEPYAWQHVYGSPDDPISLEVDMDTLGYEELSLEENVTPVRGPRLRQTVSAILSTIERFANDTEPYSLKVLHIRPIAFRAIVLERNPPSPSLAFPLPPLPAPLVGRDVLELDELIELLQSVVKRPEEPRERTHNPINQEQPETYEPQPQEDHVAVTTSTAITFTPLAYVDFDVPGKLNPVYIGPLPDDQGIIRSDTIFINAELPALGTPGKVSPDDPDGPGGPGGGQYIEILIDDEPASGRITTVVPHAMKFASTDFGPHMLHFITSSGDGECLKDDRFVASRAVSIMQSDDPPLKTDGPIIIYNLPRAAHREGEVIIDFALLNVPLDLRDPNGLQEIRDHYIRVYINNLPIGELHHYNAHRINGLPADDDPYTIRLVLVRRSDDMELPAEDHPYARTKPREFLVL